ncbi:MAG TPA: hypothetical protein VJT75_07060 [Thermoleophilaceae bacterium]|nr:hypothetical protein [Thermoleophilaceae bacterium]
MADAAPSDPGRERPDEPRLGVTEAWRRLNFEQRTAAVGALLLIVSTFGPFSFVEAAIVIVAAAVLLLLYRRAQGRDFHVPFGDGVVIAAAGAWAAVLIVVRVLDRPLGQNLLALVCAAILMLAGLRERSKHPLDDLPPRSRRAPAEPDPDDVEWTEPVPDRSAHRDETLPLREVDPYRPAKVLPPPPGEEDLEDPPAWPAGRPGEPPPDPAERLEPPDEPTEMLD